MAWRVTGQPLTLAQLTRRANPGQNDAETYPDIRWDIQTYPAAGVARLTFFQAVAADPTISNMEQAGSFPDPQWFQVYGISKSYLAAGPSNITPPASGTNQTGILNDMDLIEKTQRATVALTISNKVYGPWPLEAFHPLGGGIGFITTAVDGGVGTGRAQQWGQGGPIDGGWWVNGEIVIPPKVGFSLVLTLAAAQAISVATNIRFGLVGRIYRRVL